MKKFSYLTSAFLLFSVVAFLFMACQKEQDAVSAETSDSEISIIKSVAGNGTFAGSIDESYAAALSKNFAKEYDKEGQTLRVAFSAKDLSDFITSLQLKHKSDIIYVNFGLYGKGAPAINRNDNGRMTVFFTGNKISKPSGNIKTNGADAKSDEYLNHGGLVP